MGKVIVLQRYVFDYLDDVVEVNCLGLSGHSISEGLLYLLFLLSEFEHLLQTENNQGLHLETLRSLWLLKINTKYKIK